MYFNAYRIITGVVSPFISRDKILPQLTQQASLDWETVANIAGDHLIVQALYPAILEKGVVDLIPDEFLAYIKDLHELNCKRNEMLRKQLINALLVINNLNIKPLLMKGSAHLFLDTFANVGDRLLTDLDILVPSDAIKRVSNELIATGYEFSEDHMEFIETHHHYPPLIKSGECATIELHRDLMFREQQHVFPTEYAWKKTVDITLPNNAQAKVLVPTYRVFHSFLHSCIVDKLHQRGYAEIRQLHELARAQSMYSSDIDWEEMLAYAHDHSVGRQLHANLYIASKFMNIPGLKETVNKHISRSVFQYLRVCSKLKYNWFDILDIKLTRRINRFQSKFNNLTRAHA